MQVHACPYLYVPRLLHPLSLATYFTVPTIIYIYIHHFLWADQRPVQGNISYISLQPGQYIYIAREGTRAIYILPGKVVYIAREGGSFDPHFDL